MAIKQKAAWYVLLGYLCFVYTAIPFTRDITNFLRSQNLLRLTTGLAVLLIALGAVYLLKKKSGFSLRKHWPTLAIFAVLYTALCYLIKLPEERIHLVQYGVLPALIVPLIRNHFVFFHSAVIYAILLTSVAGAIDEGIQHLVPRRYGQFADIQLNVLSALMGGALYFFLTREKAGGGTTKE